MKPRMLAAAAAALFISPTLAQNAMQTPGGVLTTVTSDYVVNLLVNSGIAAQYVGYEDKTHFIEVKNDSFVAYVGLRGCDGATRAARCTLIQPYAIFTIAGLTLSQVNQLNLQSFDLALVMLHPNDSALVAAKIYVDGGVAETNLRNNFGRFFLDVTRFTDAVKPGAVAEVSFDRRSGRGAAGAAAGIVYARGAEANPLSSGAGFHAAAARLASGADEN